MSCTERQHAHSLYRRSNLDLGFLLRLFLVHRLHLGKLYLNSHIKGNLDVLGLLVDLLLGDFLEDQGRLHFDSFTEFDNSP